MPRYLKVGSLLLVFCLLTACYSSIYHKGKITLKVVDESGSPIRGASVGMGFEQYVNGHYKGIPVSGKTDAEGKFSGAGHGTNVVSVGAEKDGYYRSLGEYRFKEKKRWHWEPWNPEVTLVLRKIENPVPMYVKDTKASLIEIPEIGKKVGFDLMEFDWIAPYGKGRYSDLIFLLTRAVRGNLDFESTLTITFPNKSDGLIVINQDLTFGSQLKLPRLAPVSGYENKLVRMIKRELGKPLSENSDKNNNYIFRVRSEEINGNLLRAIYGKMYGDIEFDPRSSKTAHIFFRYYINPDHTRNLEFDPKRNLFTDLESSVRFDP